MILPNVGPLEGDSDTAIYFSLTRTDRLDHFGSPEILNTNNLFVCFGKKFALMGNVTRVSENELVLRLAKKRFGTEVYNCCSESNFVLRVLSPEQKRPGKVDVYIIFGEIRNLVLKDGYEYLAKVRIKKKEGRFSLPQDEEEEEDLFDINDIDSPTVPLTPPSSFVDQENHFPLDIFAATELFYSIAKGSLAKVKELVEVKKMNIFHEDLCGITPLDVAKHFGKNEILEYLNEKIDKSMSGVLPLFNSSKLELSMENKLSGMVFKVIVNSKPVAFKLLKIPNDVSREEFVKERENILKLIYGMDHPNINRIFCFSKSPRIGYLLELCGKSIKKYIYDFKIKKTKIPISEKIKILAETCCGMSCLHSLGIIHHDLKWDNVLFDRMGRNVKIVDFDLCVLQKDCKKEWRSPHNASTSTQFYFAPEVMSRKYYNEKCDVFSFGIMMYELILEKIAPFERIVGIQSEQRRIKCSCNQEKCLDNKVGLHVIHHGLRPTIPVSHDLLTEKFVQIMKKCWSENSLERPSFAKLKSVFCNIMILSCEDILNYL